MLVYSSEFPLSNAPEIDIERCLIDWIVKSPHYPWGRDDKIDFPKTDTRIEVYEKEGHKLQLSKLNNDAQVITGLHLKYLESKKLEWSTEIVVISKEGTETWICVKIFCDAIKTGQQIPEIHKPYIIKSLFQSIGGGQDDVFITSDRPQYLKEDELHLIEKIINGTSAVKMPVVYASCLDNGYTLIDEKKLARWLSGIAHIVIEPSRSFSRRLAKRVDRRNGYNGVVTIYWPGQRDNYIKVFPWYYHESDAVEIEVQKIVRGALLKSRRSSEINWLSLKDIIHQKRIEVLREDTDLTQEYKEYIDLVDEQNETYKEQIEQLKGQVRDLQETNQYLLGMKKYETSRILKAGSEEEFYNGEFLDVVLGCLERQQSNVPSDSRSKHVILDLLGANTRSDQFKEIEVEIKRVLNTAKITSKETTALEKIGFSVTDEGKHYKAVYNEDSRYTFAIAKTPSDHRTGKNTASNIIKAIRPG